MLNKYHNNLLNIFVLVVTLLFTASQSQATVNESFVVDDLRYTILTEEGATGTVAVKGNNKNISGDLSIPSSVENNSITYSVNRIGWGGFVGYTNLTSVLIPDSVTAIEMEAFYNCINLSNIVIPDSVTGIGDNAFARCYSLSNVVISDNVKEIGCNIFYNCNALPPIFFNTKKSVLLRYSPTNSDTDYTIPETVTYIAGGAFLSCSNLVNVTIPNGVTTIGSEAFAYCTDLRSITIPDSVTKIGSSVFYLCISLSSVIIPDSVNEIGSSVFNGCGALPPILFSTGKKILLRYSPSNTETTYSIPDTVTHIAGSAFYSCSYLNEINIPNSVNKIGSGAFHSCTGLTSITIPDNVNKIENMLLVGCTNLTNIVISKNVTEIDDSAFGDCKQLSSIIIPSSVKKIGVSIFSDCQNLTSVYYEGNAPDFVKDSGSIYFGTPKNLINYYPERNSSWEAAIVDGKWQNRLTATWSPGLIQIIYTCESGNLTLYYTGTLYQSSDNINWIKVESASSPYKLKMTDEKLFFSVQKE